jgi:hypothetical protein
LRYKPRLLYTAHPYARTRGQMKNRDVVEEGVVRLLQKKNEDIALVTVTTSDVATILRLSLSLSLSLFSCVVS